MTTLQDDIRDLKEFLAPDRCPDCRKFVDRRHSHDCQVPKLKAAMGLKEFDGREELMIRWMAQHDSDTVESLCLLFERTRIESAKRSGYGYIGVREDGRCVVTKGSITAALAEELGCEELSPARSLKVVNHSPTGFEWGYVGSGPAQLALAILLEETSESEALEFYMEFKEGIVSHFGRSWTLASEEVQDWLARARDLRGDHASN